MSWLGGPSICGPFNNISVCVCERASFVSKSPLTPLFVSSPSAHSISLSYFPSFFSVNSVSFILLICSYSSSLFFFAPPLLTLSPCLTFHLSSPLSLSHLFFSFVLILPLCFSLYLSLSLT